MGSSSPASSSFAPEAAGFVPAGSFAGALHGAPLGMCLPQHGSSSSVLSASLPSHATFCGALMYYATIAASS